MMATTLSPSNSISSANEAFKHPLPVVRQIHKQLQATLEEKNSRLRTLVGGNYRQLLGTAETIVHMQADIKEAEEKLGRVAEGCGRGAVGKRVTGLGRLVAAAWDGVAGSVDLGCVAKMQVLSGSVVVAGRLLAGKEAAGQDPRTGCSRARDLVTAAKVLVLARLLMKSLGDEARDGAWGVDGAAELMDDIRKRLGSLRRRLLRGVDRMCEKTDCDIDDLAQVLCAYGLATNSGAKDVLRHFLHVRGEAMALTFEEEEEQYSGGEKEDNVMRALGLYTRTLLDVQALVPRRLSNALLGLKDVALLKDDALQKLEGLRLDVSERWFGDEIMFFTPYIRHDDLDVAQAAETLKGWTKRASDVLLQGFERTLGRISEFKTIVKLRTKIFEMWIREGGKAKGFDPSIMLDGLRGVVNARMVGLLEARISELHLVGAEIEATITSWQLSVPDRQSSLWDEELLDMDLQGGAAQFKQAVISHVYGRNNTVSRAINRYETWRRLIDELSTAIDQLRSQRWDNDLDSLEDDESLDKSSDLLSKDDPGMLQVRMEANLQKSYQELHQKITALLIEHKGSKHIGGIAVYVLRVLRDIRAELPKRPDLSFFGLSFIPDLHSVLISTTAEESIATFITSASKQKRVIGRALWEGTPELPIQPSPTTFKLLRGITSSMANTGNDLWSLAAVGVLRQHLYDKIGQGWSIALEGSALRNESRMNGHEDNEEKPTANDLEVSEEIQSKSEASTDASTTADVGKTESRDIFVQALFDIYVLQHALLPPSKDGGAAVSEDNKLVSLQRLLKERLDLSKSANERLHQGAKEYWRRTSLLFGLLA